MALAILVIGVAYAEGFPWQDHAAPFDNHIDTHQQSKVKNNGHLNGFFYIQYTGNTEQTVVHDLQMLVQ